MSTRFSINPTRRFGIAPLPTGYNGEVSDFTLPPVGIEDVDRALFLLFKDQVKLQVTDKNKTTIKVPVIFAAGEKWAVLRKGRALHDHNGSLIAPLVSMWRTTITQDVHDDITGRGVNQQTGEIVIHRRLSKSDRNYQSLVNRRLLSSQEDLALSQADRQDLSLGPIVGRDVGDLSSASMDQDGSMLSIDRTKNVFETIVVPSPQFFTATYEVIVWAQYQTQMVQIIESMMSSFLPQGQCWKIDTDKGYWFIAHVDGNTWNPQNNVEDMSNEERLIKYQFTVKVPAYVLASQAPGLPVAVRRYVSPSDVRLSFELADSSADELAITDPFLGSDDPTLPVSVKRNNRHDQRDDGSTLLYPRGADVTSQDDLALSDGRPPIRRKRVTAIDRDGNTVVRYVTVKTVNAKTGETVFVGSQVLSGLTILAIED